MHPRVRNVTFVADVEGDWKALIEKLSSGNGVIVTEDGRLVLAPDAGVVFGGDYGDRGPSTLRIYEMIRIAKEEHGDKVEVLLGNRDINKLRLIAELDPALPKGHVRRAWWDAKCPPYADWLGAREDSSFLRLEYILAKTMGAEGDAERRRDEVRTLRQPTTDEGVVASYQQSLMSGGDLHFILKHGKLAVLHDGVLYVHGGVTNPKYEPDHCVGWVPGCDRRVHGVAHWVDALNEWYRAAFEAWEERPLFDDTSAAPLTPSLGFRGDYGGASLLLLSVDLHEDTTGAPLRSVVTGRHLRPDGTRIHMSDGLRSALRDVRAVVCGHTPVGESPMVVRAEEGDVPVVMADTSRAPDAASVVHVGPSVVTLSGALSNGQRVRARLGDGTPSSRALGLELDDGYHVRTYLEGGDKCVLAKIHNFNVDTKVVEARDAHRSALKKVTEHARAPPLLLPALLAVPLFAAALLLAAALSTATLFATYKGLSP